MFMLFEDIAILVILAILGIWAINKLWKKLGLEAEKPSVENIEKDFEELQARMSKEEQNIVDNGLKLLKTKKEAEVVLDKLARKIKE